MSKKVAVLAVNPVNGLGLFTYLENFFENKIEYRVFAVSDSTDIKTNSGVALKADALVADLAGHAADYDAMVFSCGDAMPVFAQHADAPYCIDDNIYTAAEEKELHLMMPEVVQVLK